MNGDGAQRGAAPAAVAAAATERDGYLRFFIGPFAMFYGAIGIVYPWLPLWMHEHGMNKREAAMLAGLYGLATIAWSQPWGYLADTRYSPRLLALLCTLFLTLFFCLFPHVQNIWLLLFVAFLYYSFFTPMGSFLNSLLIARERGKRRFSLIRSVGSIGYVIFTMIMGRVIDAAGSTTIIFPVCAGVMALYAITLLWVPEEISQPTGEHHAYPDSMEPPPIDPTEPATDLGASGDPDRGADAPPAANPPAIATDAGGGTAGEKPSLLRVFSDFLATQKILFATPGIRRFLIVVLLYQTSHSFSHSFQSSWIEQLGGSRDMIAKSYALAATCEIFMFWFVDRILRGRSAVGFLALAAFAQAIRWFLMAAVPTLTSSLLTSSLHAFTFGLFYSSAVMFIVRVTPAEFRTSGQTLLMLVYLGSGTLLSNIVGGWISDATSGGMRTWYFFAAALALVSALLFLSIPRVDREAALAAIPASRS